MNNNNLFGRTLVLMAATSCVTCAAAAQSLGDVARDERARRADLKSHSNVITNDDLKRDKILNMKPVWPMPTAATTTAEVPSEPLPTLPTAIVPSSVNLSAFEVKIEELKIDDAKNISLGEYARAIRAQRAQVEAARAKKIMEATQATVAVSVAPAKAVEPQMLAAGRPQRSHEIPAPKVRSPFSWPSLPNQHSSAYLAPRVESRVHVQAPAVKLAVTAEAATPKMAKRKTATPPVAALHTVTQQTAARQTSTTAVAVSARKVKAVAAPLSVPTSKATQSIAVQSNAVKVQRGESLWTLARKHFGNGKLWTMIWKANPSLRNPNVIRAGMTLSLPTVDDTRLARAKSKGTVIALPFEKAGVERPDVKKLAAVRSLLNR